MEVSYWGAQILITLTDMITILNFLDFHFSLQILPCAWEQLPES